MDHGSSQMSLRVTDCAQVINVRYVDLRGHWMSHEKFMKLRSIADMYVVTEKGYLL